MKRLLWLVLLATMVYGQTMVVRVFASDRSALSRISPKFELDIAAARANEWYDIVVDHDGFQNITASGLPYEVRTYSLEHDRDQVLAQYHSYDQINTILRTMASTYPTICKLDSLPLRTYQGRWIYGVKISDNPNVEEESEPGLFVDGAHHSREWATVELVRYFADSLLRGYASVPDIQQIVNNIEIYCFPIINVDGYVYDYSGGGLSWRRNREPFGGQIGNDVNRNYVCGSNILAGDWGAVNDGKATHMPGNDLFCGAYGNSGDEARANITYIRSHNINAYMSYHSYSEYFMWGWGFSTATIPDNTVTVRWGNRMAAMINRLSSGTYTPGQIPVILYSVSGSSIDWAYSWCHWLAGTPALSYTTEIGTSFYQPLSDVDIICQQNFKALRYLATLTRDSVPPLMEGAVPPPQLYDIGNVNSNFTVRWHPFNTAENHPTAWELVELSNPSIKTDSLEGGTGRWTLQGFTLSTTQSHSSSHSFFSGNATGQNNAVRTNHPYLVQANDSLTFWCYYNLENNYDVAVAEVSENGREWFDVDTARFTGSQTTWTRKAYSLAPWLGKSIYIRFRCMYDDGTQNVGFYVDDIRPTCLFGTVNVVSSSIADTLYQFTSHATGTFYYYVRGTNAAWGWGDYSCIKQANVTVGIADEQAAPDQPRSSLHLSPNPFRKTMEIGYRIEPGDHTGRIDIFDAEGRLIRSFTDLASEPSAASIRWDGRDDADRDIPTGVYYVRLSAGADTRIEKAILLK